MLVVEQVHHAGRPLPHQHQVRRGLVEAQQTQGSRLLHAVHRITAVSHVHGARGQVRHSEKVMRKRKGEAVDGFHSFHHSPGNQDARDLTGEGLGHLAASHVGNAVERQAHEGGVAAGQVILDGVVDQTDQLTVAVYQHGDEQVTLHRQNKRATASGPARRSACPPIEIMRR